MGYDIAAVILAAGEGKRMRSQLVKTAHKVAGVPIVRHVVRAATAAKAERIVVVVGKDADVVREAAGPGCSFVVQAERLGTGHACQRAEPVLGEFAGTVLVLCGDAPLITPATLTRLLDTHHSLGALATILTGRPKDTRGLGRIKRDSQGRFVGIVEERDATEQELAIQEVNAGFYCFSARYLWPALAKLNNANAQGEYLLTDVFAELLKQGHIGTLETPQWEETIGINDRIWLAKAEEAWQERKQLELMQRGVTIIAPQTTYIAADVEILEDTVIWPHTLLKGRTRIGRNCEIGPSSIISDSTIDDGASVVHSVVTESCIGRGARVGPFAHLRPQSELGEAVRVGNFVEIKKSTLGEGAKVPHLAYVGDAEIGKRANLGAGVIVVNYDGQKKHATTIGDDAFVGCNANLVAPVNIGEEAFVAAGSTITRDVPAGALAVGRARQENKEGWAKRRKTTEVSPGESLC
ncbi:MAG: bifunctional UDP-N-acetylglucosamine diphosphorylase/glucosamine-1-phosphate N-acetyltransferase GlmU [Selenomonadales bacterium]|nr:bifunctional UDP-N-acetylglucosamine diphosphorylase/glucosamine-1-phosphate N-acetyltransferase GlmU [Selenomonadales bacterium]